MIQEKVTALQFSELGGDCLQSGEVNGKMAFEE